MNRLHAVWRHLSAGDDSDGRVLCVRFSTPAAAPTTATATPLLVDYFSDDFPQTV